MRAGSVDIMDFLMQVSAWGLKSPGHRQPQRYASRRYGDGNCGDSGTFSSLWFSANPRQRRVGSQFADGSIYQWELNQDDKKISHRPEGQSGLSDSYMEAEAARLGLGLAYVPVELVADDFSTQ